MAAEIFKIPLTSIPQRFAIDLSGKSYLMTSSYCWPLETWVIDMADGDTGASIFAGLPLVTGVNLLAQYAYLGIPGEMYVLTDGNDLSPPTLDNLGVECNLYYVTET